MKTYSLIRKYLPVILALFSGISLSAHTPSVNHKGFFTFSYLPDSGRVHLEIDDLQREFIYVNSLSAGIGSNDIGLDRGQLGKTRIVKFRKAGNKLLLIEPNQQYRAVSTNPAEVNAMEEAFASSVLWGFKIVPTKKKDQKIIIDITDFLLRDAHGVVKTLTEKKQGSYKLDASKSAIDPENLFAFPENVEFESIVTFTGSPEGKEIKSVVPTPENVSVKMHHSFIKLPDDQYKPRVFHPNSGYFVMAYQDYAVPINEPITQRVITRHRLEKKNPEAEKSEAREPIIYYIDRGCPEPVKSALIDGAMWWNQAFKAAGFINAFQVREMPEDAHPLDVRYNVIQWVHRSTRGWSYGASVTDPRTGEIIKGHVSLGSLRVRQDYMIAQGIISPFTEGVDSYAPLTEIALARLRQLSAHEVGHTLGLAHNFAASVNDRSSVMDYPHPFIPSVDINGDITGIYDDKIGEWDKFTIRYGYSAFATEQNEKEALKQLIEEARQKGYHFISDADARPTGSVHPFAHLWDNGVLSGSSDYEAIPNELKRLISLRRDALQRFGKNTITSGTPYSELEKILVPVYLMHRYQAEATSKIIGGIEYNYAVKDSDEPQIYYLQPEDWKPALDILLSTLNPEFLRLPEHITRLIPPPAYGYTRDRESFKNNTGLSPDPLSMAESSATNTLSLLLHPQRLSRINQLDGKGRFLTDYINEIILSIFKTDKTDQNSVDNLIGLTQKLLTIKLIEIVRHKKADHQIKAAALFTLSEIKKKYLEPTGTSDSWEMHKFYLRQLITDGMDLSKTFTAPETKEMPPGSPIGCDH